MILSRRDSIEEDKECEIQNEEREKEESEQERISRRKKNYVRYRMKRKKRRRVSKVELVGEDKEIQLCGCIDCGDNLGYSEYYDGLTGVTVTMLGMGVMVLSWQQQEMVVMRKVVLWCVVVQLWCIPAMLDSSVGICLAGYCTYGGAGS